MDKEEILRKEYSSRIMNWDKAYRRETFLIEAAHAAMDEYAKQQCIELLNWMFAGASETIPYPGPNMWLRDLANQYKDSAALYDAFLTEQSL